MFQWVELSGYLCCIMCWSILLWHEKPVINVDTKEIITNGLYFWMSELRASWQRPQMWDLLSAKGSGSQALPPEITLNFAFHIVSHRSNSSWYFRIFYVLLRCCCCHLGLPRLLQLPFSAPCQPPQCLDGWPTAAWRSGTWSPSGCLLYCFQPIFCGSHGVAHVQGAWGCKRTAHPSFLVLEWLPLLNHNQYITVDKKLGISLIGYKYSN